MMRPDSYRAPIYSDSGPNFVSQLYELNWLLPALIVVIGAVGVAMIYAATDGIWTCLLYTSPSPRDGLLSRMPSSA